MSEFRLEGVPPNIARMSAWIGDAGASEHLPLLDPGTGQPLDPQTPHKLIQQDGAVFDGLHALAPDRNLSVDIVHFDRNDPQSLGPDFEEKLAGADYLFMEAPGWNDAALSAQVLLAAKGQNPQPGVKRMLQAAITQGMAPRILAADWKREEKPLVAEAALKSLNNARYAVFDQIDNKQGEAYRTFHRLNVAYEGLREWVMLGRMGYSLAQRRSSWRALGMKGAEVSKEDRERAEKEHVRAVLALDPVHADVRRKLDVLGIANTVSDHTAERDMDLMTAQLPEMLRQSKLIPERYAADDQGRHPRFVHHYKPQSA